MKKLLRSISILLIFALVFVFFPFSFSAAASDNLSGKTILFFGDSLTEFGGTSRYSNLVAANFPNSTIINAGYRGDTTYQARLRFENDVIKKSPDIVFICFGMNDAAVSSDGNNYKPMSTYRRNIQNFINALKAINCDVVLMTPNPVNGYRQYYSNGNHVEYCDVLRELAAINNVGLVDMYTVFTESGYVNSTYISDGLHQTAKGHMVYSDNITAYLNAVYNKQNNAVLTFNCVTEGGKKIGSYSYVGATDAKVKICVPQIEGFDALSSDITTTLSTRTVEFKYLSAFENALKTVNSINRNEYKSNVLAEIDYCIKLGENSESADLINLVAKRLEYLVTVKGDTELVQSRFVKYTTTAPNYYQWDSAAGKPSDTLHPLYIDDNKRLADGLKSNVDGDNRTDDYYSGWNNSNVEIVFDFGKKTSADEFRVYCTQGLYGVDIPTGISVSVSDDGTNYTKFVAKSKSALIQNTESWDTYCITVSAPDVLTARYFKITVNTATWGAKCAFIDEVEIALSRTDFVPVEDPAPDEPKPDEPKPDEPKPDEPQKYSIGDVNKSGAIDMMDYVLLKRNYFGTFEFDSEQISIGDVNESGAIDMMDYVLLKRAYFGTYKF